MDILSGSFQTALLRATLCDKTFLTDRRSCLEEGLFSDEEERIVATAALDYFDRYSSTPDPVALEHALSSVGWDTEQVNTAILRYFDPPEQLRFLRNQVLEFAQKRKLELMLERVAMELDGATFEEIRAQLLEVAYFGDEKKAAGVQWHEDMASRLRAYKNEHRKGMCPSGISAFDDRLDGGLAAGEVGVILAPPNKGKTTNLIALGKGAMMHSKKVLHYTLEMSRESVMRRYDQSILGVTKQDLRSKQKTVWAKMQAMVKELTEARLMVKEYPMHKATPSTIEAHLDTVAQRDGFVPDLLVLDYGALLKSGQRYNDRRDEISSVFREVHAMAKTRHFPVWTAHQTNRGGLVERTKPLDLEDLGECFEVAAIVDAVVSINQTMEERRRSTARLYWAKNREEEAGVTDSVLLDFPHCDVKDID